MKLKILLVSIFLLKFCCAAHFRGGGITAKFIRDNGGTVTMEFTERFAWRRTTFFCNDTTISNNGLIGDAGNVRTDVNWLVSKDETLFPSQVHCTSFSDIDNWSYGERTFPRDVKKAQYVEAFYNGTAWITPLAGGSGAGPWEIRIKLDTTVRPDTGTVNNTPLTTMPPLIRLRKGVKYLLKIPTADADNDVVKCRWSNATLKECASVCLKVSPGTLSDDCSLDFDATKAVAVIGFYVAAIQLEDFKTSTDTVPMSSVPYQFLIELVSSTSSCFLVPKIIGDRPASSCIASPFGIQFNERIVAQVECPGERITEIKVLGPTGNRVTALTQIPGTTNQWYVNVSWSASMSQYGPNVICGLASDSTFLISEMNCFTVLAGINPVSLVYGTPSPSGFLSATTLAGNANGMITWTVKFNANVLRPTKSSYVKFYNSKGVMLFQLDVSVFPTVDYMNDTLTFETGNSFDPGDYYILFDYGIGVGSEYCKPESDAIKDPLFWPFTVSGTTTTIGTTSLLTVTPPISIGQIGLSSSASPIPPLNALTTTSTTTTTAALTFLATVTGSGAATSATSNSSGTVTTISSSYMTTTKNKKLTANCTSSIISSTTSECNTESLILLFLTFFTSSLTAHVTAFYTISMQLSKKIPMEALD